MPFGDDFDDQSSGLVMKQHNINVIYIYVKSTNKDLLKYPWGLFGFLRSQVCLYECAPKRENKLKSKRDIFLLFFVLLIV